MKSMIIFWGEVNDAEFSWYIPSSENTGMNESINPSVQSAIHDIQNTQLLKADLAVLADMASAYSVTLVLSANDVFHKEVDVPSKAQRMLRKAVPFMLEEDIPKPIESQFFAFGKNARNSSISVRALDRDYLQAIVDTFTSAEIKLAQVISEVDLVLPVDDGTLCLIDGSNCIVKEPNADSWLCQPEDFSWLAQKKLDDKENDKELPIAINLTVIADEPVDEFIHSLPAGRFAPEVKTVESIHDYLCKQIYESGATDYVNLLQEEFEPKKEASALNGFLLKVASVAGIVLAAHLIYQGVSIYADGQKVAQLNEQKNTLYKQAFPGKKATRRPDKIMKSYLKSLGDGGDDGGFLTILESTSAQLKDLNKLYPTNINYDIARNELRLDVIAESLGELDSFVEHLRSAGHQVEKSSETQRGNGYSSRITVRK